MTYAMFVLLAGAACAFGATGDIQLRTTEPRQRLPLELSIEVDRQAENPYDPGELDVRVQVIAPSGHTSIVPAFYMEPHRGEAAGSAVSEVQRFHFFLNASDWPPGSRLAFDVDDLELSNSGTGQRRVLDDMEGELRWTPGTRIAEAHTGQGAMRFEVTTAPQEQRWPGTTLPLGTQDWTEFDTLSVWIRPISGLQLGRLGLEFYNSAGEKFQTHTENTRGEGWRRIVWRFAPIFIRTDWEPAGPGEWRARVFPQEAGYYRFTARVGEAEGSALRVEVRPREGGGFLGVDEQDPRYLRLDSGESVFLIGTNLLAREAEEYRHYFDRLAAVGANFVRLWLSPPYLGFETEHLGRFDQARAAQLDRVFELAAERGIYIMPAIMDFRETQTTGGSGPAWSRSLFAAENGGPCASAVDFYTNPTARAIFKRRLRYLVARYGAYPSLMCWEFFNEVNLVDAWREDPEIVRRWHAEMAAYLESIDPNAHIITSSFAGLPDDALWDQPLMHLVQRHEYYIGPGEFAAQIRSACEVLSRHRKPQLVGEFGRTRNLHADADARGASLQRGIWSTLMSGSCGTGMPWWWRWIDTYDLWRHMGAVATFIEGIDFGAEGFEVLPEIEATVGAYDENAVGDAGIDTPSPWSLRSIPIEDRPREVTVGADGRTDAALPMANNLWGGQNAALTVHFDALRPGKLSLCITHARRNPSVVIAIDGAESAPQPVPELSRAAHIISFDIPAGRHTAVVRVEGGGSLSLAGIVVGKCVQQPPVVALGMRGRSTTLLWVRNTSDRWCNELYGSTAVPARDVTVRIPAMPWGDYRVRTYDTREGKWLAERTVRSDGAFTLTIPELVSDIAFRIERE